MEVFVKQPLKSCEDVSVLVVACDELTVIETCAVIKERLDVKGIKSLEDVDKLIKFMN